MKNTTLLLKLQAIQLGLEDSRRQLFLGKRDRKCFGSDEEVGKSSKWWFDKIHPEDSIKCL
jgi:hypothetical protein